MASSFILHIIPIVHVEAGFAGVFLFLFLGFFFLQFTTNVVSLQEAFFTRRLSS